jgi:uncharacterized membrane protein
MKAPIDPYLVLFQISNLLSSWPYLKLAIIVVSVFVFIVLLAYVRVHIFKISMQGAVFGFFSGALLIIVLDLIVIFAFADKEKIKQIFSQNDSKKAFSEVVFSGVTNLNKILGASTTIISQKPKNAREVVEEILLMNENEVEKVKTILCPK